MRSGSTAISVIKARPIRTRADVASLSAFHTDFHLLDAYVPGRRGGTGETFDWDLAAQHASTVPVILSGGLTPANVGAAIEAVRPGVTAARVDGAAREVLKKHGLVDIERKEG